MSQEMAKPAAVSGFHWHSCSAGRQSSTRRLNNRVLTGEQCLSLLSQGWIQNSSLHRAACVSPSLLPLLHPDLATVWLERETFPSSCFYFCKIIYSRMKKYLLPFFFWALSLCIPYQWFLVISLINKQSINAFYCCTHSGYCSMIVNYVAEPGTSSLMYSISTFQPLAWMEIEVNVNT